MSLHFCYRISLCFVGLSLHFYFYEVLRFVVTSAILFTPLSLPIAPSLYDCITLCSCATTLTAWAPHHLGSRTIVGMTVSAVNSLMLVGNPINL